MHDYTRTCPHCDADFTPIRSAQKYCNPTCQKRAEKARANKRKRATLSPKPCKNCGTALEDRNNNYCGKPDCVRTTPITCRKCKEDKAPEEFYRDRARSNGYHQNCKPCARAVSAERYRRRTGSGADYNPNQSEYGPGGKPTIVTANCLHCGKEFRKPGANSPVGHCSSRCGGMTAATKRRGGERAPTKTGVQAVLNLCVICNEAFSSNRSQTLTCSKSCREMNDRNIQSRALSKRRARLNSVYYEPVNRHLVFERDGWICGICDGQIDKELKFPEPGSASLDHVTPISKGGNHVLGNVQAAHLRCNQSRQTRPLEEARRSAEGVLAASG